MIRSLPPLSLAALAFLTTPAMAQQPDDADVETIVVTGAGLPLPPGTPAYGSVIIRDDRLDSSASGRLENVLQDVAGFQQFRRSDSRSANPSAQGVTLRALGGNASSRTLMLLDGVPLADPFFGYIPFSALSPDRLSVVRVTRGGGSGAFGAGAVAGTIELASATRDRLPLASASAFYGSRDATELEASLSPDLGGGYVTVSGRWDRGDGFNTTPASQRTSATVPARYDGWSTNLRAVIPVQPDVELQFRALLFEDNRTLRFAGADSMSSGQDLSLRLVSRGPWKIDALVYGQARDFSNIVISSSTFRKTLDQRATPSTGIGGKIEIRPPVGSSNVLRIGTDFRLMSGDMFEDAYNANLATNPLTASRHAYGEQSTVGFFAENDWTLGPLILTGGIRADRWTIRQGITESRNPAGVLTQQTRQPDRDDWQVTGRAGAILTLSDVFALRGAGYTGFRLPTLNELYRGFSVFPVTTQANANLAPEKLRGVEAGFDVTPAPGITLSATAFYNRLEDAIANVTIGTNLRQRRNVDAVVAKGIELAGSADVGPFSLSASYAYNRSKVDAPGLAFDGLVPAQVPRHAASGTLSFVPAEGALISTTLRYVSRQYEDDLQTDALPGAVTLDGYARMPIGRGVSIVGRAENIFDKAVVTRNQGGSIDLGTPRTLWIGVSFRR
ncbi:TonB-dependent receptor plug domain-containing protein [Sphingobium sp. CR28]|uniref:TonB-dependent receptor plug domain-containing protein n=1 Tax=Sphingobium sp. CR28 TaxID=3400272 RepID=UPI003FEE0786